MSSVRGQPPPPPPGARSFAGVPVADGVCASVEVVSATCERSDATGAAGVAAGHAGEIAEVRDFAWASWIAPHVEAAIVPKPTALFVDTRSVPTFARTCSGAFP